MARNSPQLATRTQYFSGDEQDALDRQLALVGEWGNTYGVGEAKKRADLATRSLTTLRSFDRNTLTPSQQLTASVVEWLLEAAVTAAQFAAHRYVFDQFNGLHLDLVNFLTQTHPIRNKRDVENYLGRLALVSTRLDEGIAAARVADDAGIRPPSFIVERTMQQIDGLLKQTGRCQRVRHVARRTARRARQCDPAFGPRGLGGRRRIDREPERASRVRARSRAAGGAAAEIHGRGGRVAVASRRGVLPVGARHLHHDDDDAGRDSRGRSS